MKKSESNPVAEERVDALQLLQEDHDHLLNLFKEYKYLIDHDDENIVRKEQVAIEACDLLQLHTQLEEEIFYPAVRKSLNLDEIMAESKVEHDTAGELIDDLRKLQADDEIFDAKFIVLSEIAAMHIKKEEAEIFPLVRQAKTDTIALGRKLSLRREVLVIGMRIGETLQEMNQNVKPVDEAAGADAAGLLPDILVPPPGFR
ncbi:MAG TPA: hemerythrin domain-containing protein [Patescibacteria group bacterium]|nr:hemerythrin domain-containing protein [Patescibacteria group bacterium]